MFSPTHEEVRTRYAGIGSEIASAAARRAEGFDAEGWRRLRDAGLWRLLLPEDGALPVIDDWWAFSAALDGLSSTVGAPELLLSVIAQAGLVRGLVRHGTPAQRERYLGAIARGELSATGIAEPATGTDVRSITTTLTETACGYVLDGGKYNIAHAPLMDFALVVCRLPDRARNNIALALIDRDAPGLRAGAPDDKLGNRNLPTGSLHFDAVPVRPDQLLGAPGRGLGILIDTISLGRLYYGLVAANLLAPHLAEAMAYAATRTSFETTIAEHQHVQRRLVDIRTGMARSRWTALGALGQLLGEQPDALLHCSIAKLVGADDLIAGATSLVKLYGSSGYHAGRVADLMKDALGFASIGGTEEMHRKNIFNQMGRAAG